MMYKHVTTGYYNWKSIKLTNGETWEYINTGKWWRLWEANGINNKNLRFKTLKALDRHLTEYIETNQLERV